MNSCQIFWRRIKSPVFAETPLFLSMKIEEASILEFDMNSLENNQGGQLPYQNIAPLQYLNGRKNHLF